jgi:hypothetical protein
VEFRTPDRSVKLCEGVSVLPSGYVTKRGAKAIEKVGQAHAMAARISPGRLPVQFKNGEFPWLTGEQLAELGPPKVSAELVVRQGMREAAGFLGEEIKKLFAAGELPANPGDGLQVELAIHRVFAQAADRLHHRIIEAVHQSEAFVQFSLEDALSRPQVRREGDRNVPLTFLGGSKLSVRTPYVLARRRGGRGTPRTQRGKEGNGSYPVLRQLGFLGRISPGLVSEIGSCVTNTSIEEAQADLQRRGKDVDFKTVRTVALRLAGQGVQARDALLRSALEAPPEESSVRGLRLVISTDGGKVKVRVGGKRGRRNQKTRRRKYRTKWVEPRVLVIHVIDEKGKKIPHEVGVLDASIADCDEVFRMLIGYLKLLGAHEAAQLVIVADGAKWIWEGGRVQELVRKVGIAPERVVEVLDFYHATEHLGKIAALRASWSDKERQRWIRRVRTMLWRGKVDAVLEECRMLCRGRRSKKITALLDYIDRNRLRLNYPLFRQLKVPLGSGVIESAVRRVINLRLKGPGIIWEEENVEKMLHMRAQMKLGSWNRFVTNALNYNVINYRLTRSKTAPAAAM